MVSPAFDGVNRLNYQTQIVPVPNWKAQLFAEYTRDIHNLRITLNYIDSYIDQRAAPFPPNIIFNTDGTTRFANPEGRKIDAFLTVDASYRVMLPWDMNAVFTVDNVFNEDPSFARLDLLYDPFTGNALGRTYKLNLTKKF